MNTSHLCIFLVFCLLLSNTVAALQRAKIKFLQTKIESIEKAQSGVYVPIWKVAKL